MSPPARVPPGLWCAVALAWSAVVYAPIVFNFFFADDFLNLYRIANLPALEYLLTPHGGHVLLARNAIFWAFRAAFGVQPELYFAAVLCTHLLNVGLLFAAARALTGSAPLACVAAALWGGAPLHQGTLGWYSVYGQVVTATALLAVLAGAARLRAAGRAPARGTLRGWYALALIAATSFGVGLGAALALPAALALLLPDWRRWSRRPPLLSLLLVVPALYVAVHALYGLLVGGPLPGEREMSAALRATLPDGVAPTGPALLLAYLRSLPYALALLLELLAYACAQLLAASAPAVRGGPVLWGAALLAVVVAGAVAARLDPRTRRVSFALAVLALGCYATIALGRGVALHVLGVAHAGLSDRYHYAATVPLALLFAVVLGGIGRGVALAPRAARALTIAALAWIVASHALWAPPIDHHDVARLATTRVLAEIARVAETAPASEPVFLANRAFSPTATVLSPTDFPGWSGLYIAFEPPGSWPLRFVEPNAAAVQAAARGRRGGATLATPDQVPAGVTVLKPNPVDAGLVETPFGFPR